MLSLAQARSSVSAFLFLCSLSSIASAQVAVPSAKTRIAGRIDDAQVVTLAGNVHPSARGEFDRGVVADETRLSRLVLRLEPSAAQQAELDSLVEAQHDSQSPLFHQWLTPQQFGARFGANVADLTQITGWLESHGLSIDEVAASRQLIIFSGNAGQVADAFHTEIHRYRVGRVEHIANAQDPQIPAALSGLVGGIVSLHDFRRASQVSAKTPLSNSEAATTLAVNENRSAHDARPDYTRGSTHYLFPADWATIYDLNSLYAAGKTGTGTSIAIVGRSNINMADVTKFRSGSGLVANNPTVIFVSSNPGLIPGDQDESTLDVEWSGAVAPAASIKFVVGASTATSDGVDLSAQYIVNHATAQVMSTSYGSCEQDMGASELSFYNGLWQQAAAEGISSFVSSGDSGAAGCGSGSSTRGSVAAVNGLCSSPYSTCVGGTQFNEGSNAAKYWASTNSSSSESALSYIPEAVWNESASNGGSGLWASTGGVSVVYPQPSWQRGVPGVTGSMRELPDVAMTAASHDGYIITENGNYYVIAGTSAASPSFAGVMALVVQAQGGKGQGNANPALYAMLNGSKNPFHATPSGNNSVPGVSGFTASGAAYNAATGLGSVDGAVLVGNWNGGSTVAPPTSGVNFALTQSASTGAMLIGKTVTLTVGVTESGAAASAVTLAAKLPAGITASFSKTSILPGNPAIVTFLAGPTAIPGTQTATITGTDSTGTQSVSYVLTVTQPPTLTLSAPATTVAVAQGTKTTANLTAATAGSFTGPITWGISGLPAGVAATWSTNPTATVTGATTNVQTLILTASGTAAAANVAISVTAAGDGLVATKALTLQVTPGSGISLAIAPAAISMSSSATASLTVTATPVGGLQIPSAAAGSMTSVVSGLPVGISASWSAPTLTTTGAVKWTLTLSGSTSAAASSSQLRLAASVLGKTGISVTAVQALPLTVTPAPPTLALAAASYSLSVVKGTTVADSVTLGVNGTYSGAVNLTVSGLPSGVTAAWSNAAVTPSALSGVSTLTLTAAANAATTTAAITVTAKGDGLVATRIISLQVSAAKPASARSPVRRP